jgi:hypothetical protein
VKDPKVKEEYRLENETKRGKKREAEKNNEVRVTQPIYFRVLRRRPVGLGRLPVALAQSEFCNLSVNISE